MISKSFTNAKRIRCQTRSLRNSVRLAKVLRSKSERRAAHRLLKLGHEDIPRIILSRNHVGHAAWMIA